MRLILASGSRYRRELLGRLGIPFEVRAPDIDETALPHEAPPDLALRLAISKARVGGEGCADALVIGSDQVADYNGEIVGKSGAFAEAKRQLMAISGRTAQLYTGLAVFNTRTGNLQTTVERFGVAFRTLSEPFIERYLHREQPYDCAGSVKSEGLGVALLERFEGDDPTTLIGLPLIRLVRMLENEGMPVI
ncbi:MAG: Maf family nucleotide pyrophosphatase [Gammaproteobacteria bacterium]|nr:Maf family nucleotide pyrophosphatase [Gammaproteobacteria bacterium]